MFDNLPPAVSAALVGMFVTFIGVIVLALIYLQARIKRATKKLEDDYAAEKARRIENDEIKNERQRLEIENISRQQEQTKELFTFVMSSSKETEARLNKTTDDLINLYKSRVDDRLEIEGLRHTNEKQAQQISDLQKNSVEQKELQTQRHAEREQQQILIGASNHERDTARAAYEAQLKINAQHEITESELKKQNAEREATEGELRKQIDELREELRVANETIERMKREMDQPQPAAAPVQTGGAS